MAVFKTWRARLAAAAIAMGAMGLAASPPQARADGQQAAMSPAEMQRAKGVIQEAPLGNGLNLELRKGFALVPAADASAILQRLGAPSPSAPILAAVTAEGAKPGAKDYWICVITEDPIGHVAETGAGDIASMSFFDSVKQARPPAPALMAFAITPSYAPAAKTLVWAEQYDVKGANLRHEQRLLGRDSVAGLTTIGSAKALKKIAANAKIVRAMLTFTPGKTYSDFVAGSDRVSDYDLPGLITGKRRAGPMPEASPAPAPAAAQLTLAAFAPGGRLQWVPWLGGGVVLLGGAFLAVSALRRRSSGIDYTAQDSDGNAT